MSDDPKLDFYLENRALIEEWAQLRDPVAIALDRELRAAAVRPSEGVPDPKIHESPARSVRLHVATDPMPKVWLELWWEKGKLLKGSGSWPQLVIVMDPPDPPFREAVKNATGSAREAHDMTSTGPKNSPWIRYGQIPPQSDPIVIEEYADHCVQRLRAAWLGLDPTIRVAVETATGLS